MSRPPDQLLLVHYDGPNGNECNLFLPLGNNVTTKISSLSVIWFLQEQHFVKRLVRKNMILMELAAFQALL